MDARCGSSRVAVAWCSLDATESHTFRFWSLLLQAVTVARPELAAAGLAAPHRAGADGFLNDLVRRAGRAAAGARDREPPRAGRPQGAGRPRPVREAAAGIGEAGADEPVGPAVDRPPGPAPARPGRAAASAPSWRSHREELQLLAPDLDEEMRQVIWERTDGWPALVQLMLLALRTQSELPLTPFEDDYVMAEYLFRELMRRQDPPRPVADAGRSGPGPAAPRPRGAALRHDRCRAGSWTTSSRPRGWSRGPRYPSTSSRGTGSIPCCVPTCGRSWRARTGSAGRRCRPRRPRGSSTAGLPLEAVHHARASEDAQVLEQVVAAAGWGWSTPASPACCSTRWPGPLPGHRPRRRGPTWWPPRPSPTWAGHRCPAASSRWLGPSSTRRGVGLRPRRGLAGVDLHVRRRRGFPLDIGPGRASPPRATSPDVQVYAAVQQGGALLTGGDLDCAVGCCTRRPTWPRASTALRSSSTLSCCWR